MWSQIFLYPHWSIRKRHLTDYVVFWTNTQTKFNTKKKSYVLSYSLHKILFLFFHPTKLSELRPWQQPYLYLRLAISCVGGPGSGTTLWRRTGSVRRASWFLLLVSSAWPKWAQPVSYVLVVLWSLPLLRQIRFCMTLEPPWQCLVEPTRSS